MKKALAAVGLALALASAGVYAADVPTLAQVEQSIQQGNWPQADAQLAQVVGAYPNNPRAHYLYGQVLAREGRSSDALAQVERAKSIDPQIRFADPAKFARIEAHLRADTNRQSGATGGALAAPQTQAQSLAAPAAPASHGPSTGLWIGFAVLIGVLALVLRWTLRRARNAGSQQNDDERRAQLKRATDVLNAVRPLKLDARISTVPGATALVTDIDNLEAEARGVVDKLSNGTAPVAPYQLDSLEQQLSSLQARVAGRPDPNAVPPIPAGGSVYAQEADRAMGAPGGVPPGYPPGTPYPYPPQPVVVQQGGGFGSGMGGLLGGVLLGEALSGGHDRVIERDVIVNNNNDDSHRQNPDPGFDLGQNDNWGDSGVDMGDGGDWNS